MFSMVSHRPVHRVNRDVTQEERGHRRPGSTVRKIRSLALDLWCMRCLWASAHPHRQMTT